VRYECRTWIDVAQDRDRWRSLLKKKKKKCMYVCMYVYSNIPCTVLI
jgi:hypothetical protein